MTGAMVTWSDSIVFNGCGANEAHLFILFFIVFPADIIATPWFCRGLQFLLSSELGSGLCGRFCTGLGKFMVGKPSPVSTTPPPAPTVIRISKVCAILSTMSSSPTTSPSTPITPLSIITRSRRSFAGSIWCDSGPGCRSHCAELRVYGLYAGASCI
jgi:hypothetical protein